MCAQRRFRSACAFAQSDQNLHWARFYNQECKVSSCEEQTLIRCADAQADLSLGWVNMFDCTFSTSRHKWVLITCLPSNVERTVGIFQKAAFCLRFSHKKLISVVLLFCNAKHFVVTTCASFLFILSIFFFFFFFFYRKIVFSSITVANLAKSIE